MSSRAVKSRPAASRMAASRTADLFAAADVAPAHSPAPAPARSPAPAPAPAPPQPPAPAPAPPPPLAQPLTAGRTRAHQLWYAVVFPDLREDPHSAAVLQRLCMQAQTFTSFVSIEPPNALLLEIKGSLQLLGPLDTLHANIDACWRRLALSSHSATAPSTLAALWFARAGTPADGIPVQIEDPGTLPGRMAALPVACTAWTVEHLRTLRALGVTRLGELLRLPRAGLARRLGAAAVRDLDLALARLPAPRRTFAARERFYERCDFETEIETVAYLEKALEPLIGRCAEFLRKRQAGVQRLRLKLRHRAGPATCVHFGLAGITSERRRLTEVVAQKLGRVELPEPVRSMELKSGFLQPLSAASLDIFSGGAGAGIGAGRGYGSMPQLVERLRARLGEESVYGVVSLPEHRPEAAWRRVHELTLAGVSRAGDGRAEQAMAGGGMPRPLWLLDTPQPLSEPPIRLEQGPERIESGWWDGKGVARDYYVAHEIRGARQSHGAKLWVFQDRQSRRWYLHGVFA